MTDQEIIVSAIEKAIKRGWVCPSLIWGLYHNTHFEIKGQSVEMIRGFITGHDFAKALWGEDWANWNCALVDQPGYDGPRYVELMAWQYHLQQMVIADDPIKYLGANI